MKIAYDAKRAFHNSRGLGTYSREVIRLMNAYFPDNDYYLFNPKRKNAIELALGANNTILYPESLWHRKFPALWRTFGISRELQKLKVDVYHGLSQELPARIQKTGVKSVVTMHDAIFMRYPHLYPKAYRKIFIEKNKYACMVADKIIAISLQTKKDIVHYFQADENKIEIVYQGCSNIFRQQISEQEKIRVRDKYNLPQQYLLNVGAVEKRKNIELIIKALHHGKINIPLVVVGKATAYMQELKQLLTQFGLEGSVIFIQDAATTDLPAIYTLAEIFIYPSVFEGFGIPVLEALCTATPVIAATGSCLEESGGPSSLYVDAYNVAEMSAAINTILADGHLQIKMKADGLKYAEKFSDENIGNNLMRVYKNLLP